MKRIFSLLMVITLVVSFFNGITFALRTCEIVLDTQVVEYKGGANLVTVSGSIVDSSTGAITNANNRIYIQDHETYSTVSENGRFSIMFYSTNLGVGNFRIAGESNAEVTFIESTENQFRVVPRLQISNDTELHLDFPISGSVVVQGSLPNKDGDDYSLQLGYVDTDGCSMLGTALSTAIMDTNSFGFLFNGSIIDKVGDIGIFANNALVAKGTVSPSGLAVSVSPSTIPRFLGNQPITFDFNLKNEYTDGDILAEDYELRFSAISPEDILVHKNTLLVNDTSKEFTNSAKQSVTQSISCSNWDTGTAELLVQLYNTQTNTVVLEKTLTLNIVNPEKYTLVGWGLEQIAYGDIQLALPDSRSGSYSSSGVDQKIEVKKYNNGGSLICNYIEVQAKGCGIDETFINFGPDAVKEKTITITPERTGLLEFTIKVYSNTEDMTPRDTFTREVKVVGYNITYEPSVITADSNTDFFVHVLDGDGKPVNNATIKLNGIAIINGGNANIVGGEYQYKDDHRRRFKAIGALDLTIEGNINGIKITNYIEEAIDVVGKYVYNVSSSTDQLVNGSKEYVYFTTKSYKGTRVYPDFERIDISPNGDKSNPEPVPVEEYVDLDGDGLKEAAKLKLIPNSDQIRMIIRASTDNGKLKGETSLKVMLPKVKLLNSHILTENFNTDISFEITDPRDGSVFDKEIFFIGDNSYVDFTVADSDMEDLPVQKGISNLTLPNSNNVYNYTVFVNDVDWDKIQDEHDNPPEDRPAYNAVISIVMKSGTTDVRVLDIPIKEPSLTSDPSIINLGESPELTLTYLDGAGNPLEGYDVRAGWRSIGETDAFGKIKFSGQIYNMLVFEATTDDEYYQDSYIYNQHEDNIDNDITELVIRPGYDTQGPTITAPQSVTTDEVTITINDKNNIEQAIINGDKIDIFYAQPELTHKVALQEGINKIEVIAVDTYDNRSNTILTVVYDKNGTTTTTSTITFTIGEKSPYGVPELKAGTTTMVPVRFAESLGATIKWNNTTQTVTYSLGNTIISLTIGEKYALKNGQKIPLNAPAYLNELGRTFVPLRMIANELGYKVQWTSNGEPISIIK